ncbi:MAG: hypothetical protein PUF12_04330 [Thermoflexaceae bacterium]|nr:hypothetical protein [Thermoflexaceae bacterium]
MYKTPYQIYDIIFKKILTLSSTAVINLINGLFETAYDADSQIEYNWTEFTDDRLRKVLADTIITINGRHSYHMEAQMTEDDDIIFRVFDYGYGHARQNASHSQNTYTLKFPEPKIIYLYCNHTVPDEYILTLDFGTQGTFDYHVSTFNFLEISPEELNHKKMIILIPFALLKLRKTLEKERTPQTLNALKKLIQNDILTNIDVNETMGNITPADAAKLRSLTHRLYEHIYSHYEEMKELNDMTDETILLDIDIMEDKIDKLNETISQKELEIEQKNTQIAQKDTEIIQKNTEIAQKDTKIAQKDTEIAQKDTEIALLKEQLEKLQSKK